MYFSLLWLQLVNTAVFHRALKILQPLKLGGRVERRGVRVKEMHSFSLRAAGVGLLLSPPKRLKLHQN